MIQHIQIASALALFVLVGCQTVGNKSTKEEESGMKPSKPETKPAAAPEPEPASLPGVLKKPAQKAQTDDDGVVTFRARLDMDRLSGGKRFQGTMLHLDDGRVLVASYRPIPKYFEFVDRRVVIKGKHYSNPPNVQQIMADHFQIISVELAPGEKPYATKPTTLPTPPAAASRAELRARAGRWVQLFVTVKSGGKHKNDSWCDVIVALPDGTPALATMYLSTFESDWKPLFGKKATVIAQVKVDKKDPKHEFKLVGQTSVCPGKVDRCGMR